MTATHHGLELHDIQGDILRAYGNAYDVATYVFVGLTGGPAGGRAWLSTIADQVSTAAPWEGAKPPFHLNAAVTAAGLEALGISPEAKASFSSEFCDGMRARATRLGDTGRSAPEHWDDGLGDGRAHVLITVNAQGTATRDEALAGLLDGLAAFGHTVVARQDARMLGGQREHFGYADGFAQPAIEGATEEKVRGGGVAQSLGRWRSLAPGEFILGYPDEDTRDDPARALPSAPAAPLGRNGTYLVWRKLHQDVALFRRTVAENAARYEGGNEALLRAKIVGRWDDGSPLSQYPDAPPAGGFDPRAAGANDFRFGADASGGRCPVGAHVRRTNPRDALGWNASLSFRHRIIRRGMPYGDPLAPESAEDDGVDRGLVFACFNASISRQFEAIQVQWVTDGNVFGLGHDSDFLMGGEEESDRSMVIQGERPFYLSPQGPFVSTRGGEYLFVPGISALCALAAGTTT